MSEVPTARIRAAINLLYPEEMTPTAKRILKTICDEYDFPGAFDPEDGS